MKALNHIILTASLLTRLLDASSAFAVGGTQVAAIKEIQKSGSTVISQPAPPSVPQTQPPKPQVLATSTPATTTTVTTTSTATGTSTTTSTASSTKLPTQVTATPKPVIVFSPKIYVDTLAAKKDSSRTTKFANGVFINDPKGGDYRVCGRVQNATDILVGKDGKALVTIEGKDYPLTLAQTGMSGDYSYCGEIKIKDVSGYQDKGKQNDKADAAGKKNITLASLFNNFQVSVRGKDGSQVSERYTVLNSTSRKTDDNIHEDAIQLILDNSGVSGDRINDYLTHAVNDMVLSNESLFGDKISAKIDEATDYTCNIEKMYENIQNKAKDPLVEFMLELAQEAYGFTHDLDGDESMWLCFDDFSVVSSNLKVSMGSDDAHMIYINGTIDARLTYKFKHSSDGYFTGYDLLESGDFVVDLGKINVSTVVSDLDMHNGKFSGHIDVSNISATNVKSWWENWYTASVWYEGEDSDMDLLDDKFNEKFAGGFYPKKNSVSKDIDKSMKQDAPVEFTFVPDATMFALVADEYEVQVPNDLTSKYSEQSAYRSTENDDFDIIQSHEMGFAFDDDVLNQELHLFAKEGKFNIQQSQTLDDGSTVDVSFSAGVAPVVSFDGEEDYAFRMDIANAKLVLVSSKNSTPMEYRLDLSTVFQMFDDGTDKVVNLTLDNSAIHLVSIKGPKAPDKMLEATIRGMINKMLSKIETQINDKLDEQIDTVFNSMPVDLCTGVGTVGANGVGNYLAGGIDLEWSNTISRTDTCFNLDPVNTQSSGSSTISYSDCEDDDDTCVNNYEPSDGGDTETKNESYSYKNY